MSIVQFAILGVCVFVVMFVFQIYLLSNAQQIEDPWDQDFDEIELDDTVDFCPHGEDPKVMVEKAKDKQ
jgi:cytosine/uracil/thiamine/allantoin permease